MRILKLNKTDSYDHGGGQRLIFVSPVKSDPYSLMWVDTGHLLIFRLHKILELRLLCRPQPGLDIFWPANIQISPGWVIKWTHCEVTKWPKDRTRPSSCDTVGTFILVSRQCRYRVASEISLKHCMHPAIIGRWIALVVLYRTECLSWSIAEAYEFIHVCTFLFSKHFW